MRKLKIVAFVLLLAAVIIAVWKPGGPRIQSPPEDPVGMFTGSSGSLTFLPDKKVTVNVTEDALWVLEGRQNEQTYGYVFILGNAMISYDKAEFFYLHDEKDTFARIVCRVDGDKIILRGEGTEAVFEKAR